MCFPFANIRGNKRKRSRIQVSRYADVMRYAVIENDNCKGNVDVILNE